MNYVITVDYYSIFFEVDRLKGTLAFTVIHKLKCQFARNAIPDFDNEPQFSSTEFPKFVKDWTSIMRHQHSDSPVQ